MHSPLFEHIAGYGSLALIGMCKNAGKTTVLGRILEDISTTRHTLGLTSIGRDGESVDLVTGTGKPGIYVQRGTLLATAEKLLPLCDITREILDTTGVTTPLGQVVLVRAKSDGHVQLAGPSTVEQLMEVSALFRRHGADRVIIDGAISRKTFCSPALAEAAVLCTGASCGSSMEAVVAQTRHAWRMLTLPRLENSPFTGPATGGEGVLMRSGGEIHTVIDGTSIGEALRQDTDLVYLPGALSDGLIRPLLLSGRSRRGLTFVARDGSKVLLSPGTVEKLEAKGIRLRVLEPVRVAAVTVNPFSAYGNPFDPQAFREAMAQAVDAPVLNVREYT